MWGAGNKPAEIIPIAASKQQEPARVMPGRDEIFTTMSHCCT